MLNKKQVKQLKKIAQSYQPVIQIGKYGVSDGTLRTLEEALRAHELVKVKLLQNSSEEKSDVAEELSRLTNSEVVQVIGRQVILYRRNPEKTVIDLDGETRERAK